MSSPGVYLFIDNSNIYISGQTVADHIEGLGTRHNYRIAFDHLLQLALAGRPLLKAFVVGSIPPEDEAIWRRFEQSTGVKPELYERGSVTGGEQGLDQCLQVHMLRALTDCKQPQVAVLMTGDGAGYETGTGFHADLERMHTAGWGVEVMSWKNHCKKDLKKWAAANGRFIALDDHYHAVTFVKGVRTASTVDLLNRPVSQVRLSPLQQAEQEESAKLAKLEAEIAALKAGKDKKDDRKKKHDKRFARGK